MKKGWIKLHRKMLDHAIVKFSKKYSYAEAWLYLLFRACYENQKVLIGSEIYNLKAGQIITSQKKLCKQFGWGNSRLRTFLKVYVSDKMIEVKTTNKLTQITIINYVSYQAVQSDAKSQTKPKQTHSKNTKKLKEDIAKRESDFYLEVLAYGAKHVPMIDPTIIEAFTNYWAEKNKSGTKMLFETKRTFEISRRMATWLSNNKEWSYTAKAKSLDEKFPLDKTGNARLGICSKCNTTVFLAVRKPSLDSKCCNAKVIGMKK
tara:strand:- start:150 stop:932 length:783 start_codon:yes stop_codon:yes gene_type:complete